MAFKRYVKPIKIRDRHIAVNVLTGGKLIEVGEAYRLSCERIRQIVLNMVEIADYRVFKDGQKEPQALPYYRNHSDSLIFKIWNVGRDPVDGKLLTIRGIFDRAFKGGL